MIRYFPLAEVSYMYYSRRGNKSKRFSPRSYVTDQIFTGEVSGMDSAGVLRQSVSKVKLF